MVEGNYWCYVIPYKRVTKISVMFNNFVFKNKNPEIELFQLDKNNVKRVTS